MAKEVRDGVVYEDGSIVGYVRDQPGNIFTPDRQIIEDKHHNQIGYIEHQAGNLFSREQDIIYNNDHDRVGSSTHESGTLFTQAHDSIRDRDGNEVARGMHTNGYFDPDYTISDSGNGVGSMTSRPSSGGSSGGGYSGGSGGGGGSSSSSSDSSGLVGLVLCAAAVFGLVALAPKCDRPNQIQESSQQRYSRLMIEASKLSAQGDDQGAARLYFEASQANPSDKLSRQLAENKLETLEEFALIHIDHGKYEEAITEYNKVLQVKPNDESSLFGEAVCYGKLGELENAIYFYDRLLKINPNQAVYWNNRGVMQQRNGEEELAIQSYQQAIKVRSDWTLPWVNEGNIHFDEKDYEQAIRCYLGSIHIHPDEQGLFLWTRIAEANKKLEKYGDAVSAYEKALGFSPKNIKLLHEKAKLNFKLERYEAAIADYTRVTELTDGEGSIARNSIWMTGRAYWKLGEQKKALQTWF